MKRPSCLHTQPHSWLARVPPAPRCCPHTRKPADVCKVVLNCLTEGTGESVHMLGLGNISTTIQWGLNLVRGLLYLVTSQNHIPCHSGGEDAKPSPIPHFLASGCILIRQGDILRPRGRGRTSLALKLLASFPKLLGPGKANNCCHPDNTMKGNQAAADKVHSAHI